MAESGWDKFRKSKVYQNEVDLAKPMVLQVWRAIVKQFPDRKIKSVESNLFHFIIYEAIEKSKKAKQKYPNLTRGWYTHGPYIMAVDDAMIQMGTLDPKYHQMCGECGGEMQEKMIIFEDETKEAVALENPRRITTVKRKNESPKLKRKR